MLRRCASIVRVLSTSCAATSRFVRPAATSAAISRSRSVSARRRLRRRPAHAVAEPAQLAHGLVAEAARAEAVERGLGGDQRLDRAPRSPAAASARPSASCARAAASGAAPAASRAAVAAESASSGARARAAPRSASRRDRGVGPRRRPRRRRRASAAAARRRAAAAAGRSTGSRAPTAAAHRRDGALRRCPAAVSAAPRHQPGWPAAWKSGRDAALAPPRRRAERAGDVAGREPRRRQRAVRPQQHPRVAGQARQLQALLGGGDGLGEPAELDERAGRLERELQQDVLAAGVGGDRGAALEVGQRGRRAARAPAARGRASRTRAGASRAARGRAARAPRPPRRRGAGAPRRPRPRASAPQRERRGLEHGVADRARVVRASRGLGARVGEIARSSAR